MDPWGVVLTAAVAGFFGAAAVSAVSRKAGYATSLLASVLLCATAIIALAHGPVRGLSWSGPLGDPEGLALDGLSGFFALAASLVWIATSGYSLTYDERRSPCSPSASRSPWGRSRSSSRPRAFSCSCSAGRR